ncbi:MscL family protein [Nocardioides sp.]|uniref:MscL family protein n=1 Tax=Nocardioides sp. TaxID=35761 RepID=UPI000C93F76D|nr:large conductance mechanosensitive channel protein MscL [Pimelobacter sp.]
MDGFKNFLFRGNLVDLAVAVIIGTAFGAVVTAFTEWLTSLLPDAADEVFSANTYGGRFMNAVIAFVILAAVVYFLVVTPYVKAKEKFFPSPAPGTPEDIVLLKEIRDLLSAQAPR